MDTALGLVWNDAHGTAARATSFADATAPAAVRLSVPAKPTLEMLTAGARAGSVSVEIAWKIFQAMVAPH